MKPYQPISCTFYDELEALATLRKSCLIKYRNDAGTETQTQALIKDFFIKDKVEYLKLDNGQHIRLDYLIEVDGKALKNYC
jgi:Rho-binding antiterminator